MPTKEIYNRVMTIALGSTFVEFKQRIESRQARIGIVGMGYVGLPLALLFSDERFRVTGFDIAADKVATFNAGGSYIVRILPAEIRKAQKAGFRRHAGLRGNRRHGRGHHLRSHSAERISRARSELRHGHGEVHRAAHSRRPAHRARKHHLSRHYRRCRRAAA